MLQEKIQIEEIRSSVETLSKDLRNDAKTMTDDEARILVESYYQMQANRIRSNNQIRQMSDEPHDVLYWLSEQSTVLERNVKSALNVYSNAHPIGQRIRTVIGVGEVIKTQKFLKEVATYGVNQAKWKAAKEYCKDRRMQFVILTENELRV